MSKIMPQRPRRGAPVSQNYDASMWDVLDELKRTAVTKVAGKHTVRNNTLVVLPDSKTIGKGGGGGAPVRITGVHPDSPTTGVRMFQGDAYANGTEEDASAEDVTIRIMDIAEDVETFPSRGLIATPISETWTLAEVDAETGLATRTETVYEVSYETLTTVPVVITSGSGTSYICDVYAHGVGVAPTIIGATFRALGLGVDDEIQIGSQFEANLYGNEYTKTFPMWV